MSAYRVSPPRIFAEATRASRPSGSAGAQDAHRQTGFVLGEDLDLVVSTLALEGTLAEAPGGAQHRNQLVAATLLQWSRGWLARLQALHAVEWGNYTAAIPLVRAAADYLAAEILVLRSGAADWNAWIAGDPVALAPAQHATEYRLGSFRAAEVLAGHDTLGPLYRAATALAMPHFGASLLLAGSDSDPGRIAVTFGDRDFHAGLAELILGWLHLLAAAQLDAILEAGEALAMPDPVAVERAIAICREAAARAGRCHASFVTVDGEERLVIEQWRRAPGSAPRRILL